MREEIEKYCHDHDFVFHKHGHGFMGRERYWTFYKVINNDHTAFSIEYYPESNSVKVSGRGREFCGRIEDMEELLLAFRVCKIEETEIHK